MAFDSLVLSAVVNELRQELPGGRVNKVHQPDAQTLVLRYHGREGHGRLLISVHPDNGRLHKTETARENPAQAPLFVMVLRKWLEGSRILDIGSADGERVAWLILEARNDIGDPVQLRLIIEIMGKHSNIILVDPQNNILDGIRRYGSSLSRYREVLPGRAYVPPPPLTKLPLPPTDEEALAAALYRQGDGNLADALRREVCGISPLLAQHLALAAGCNPSLPAEQLGEYELSQLYRQLQDLRRRMDGHRYACCLLRDGQGRIVDFAALVPAHWPPEQVVTISSMNKAVDAFYGQREAEQLFQRRRQALDKALRKHQARLDKKISLQQAELTQCEAADAYKQAADLLAAHQWSLAKGQDLAELPSFADPERTVTVKLDPPLTPQENVQRYYRRYAKAKKARGRIEQQLKANGEELDYLLNIRQSLADCEDLEALRQIEGEAIAAGYYERHEEKRRRAKEARPQDNPSSPLPPRSYVSADGFTILVGRHNKQNDRLSLKQAQEEDLWLHAQKIPGAHVIIVRQGREIPDSTIREAAAYAAWFSEAKASAQVPVDYVPAGMLRKPPGSRPGLVIYTNQRTIYVTPREP